MSQIGSDIPTLDRFRGPIGTELAADTTDSPDEPGSELSVGVFKQDFRVSGFFFGTPAAGDPESHTGSESNSIGLGALSSNPFLSSLI